MKPVALRDKDLAVLRDACRRFPAVREVREETGIMAEPVLKLSDNKYVYVRTWGDGKRVFKIVSFYLMRYVSGEIDALTADMRIEVRRALWVPLADAASQLAYSNERKVLRQAQDYLEARGPSWAKQT